MNDGGLRKGTPVVVYDGRFRGVVRKVEPDRVLVDCAPLSGFVPRKWEDHEWRSLRYFTRAMVRRSD